MKKLLYGLLIIGFAVGCTQPEGYKIQGEFEILTNGPIYLQQRVGGEFVNIDSSEIVDGKFNFNGKVDVVEEYYLSLSQRNKVLFFLENAPYSVTVDSLISDAVIVGGATQTTYNVYQEKYKKMYDYMIGEYQKIEGEPDELKRAAMEAQVDSLYSNLEQFQEDYMKENTTSPVSVFILSQIQYGKTGDELSGLLGGIDSLLADMVTYKRLADRVEALQRVAVGQIAPDFTQNDANENPITFSEIYSHNKLTLVDFWASWCGPCRMENPNVVKAYQAYNNKGFTVFGVSLDANKERWLKAIEDDGLTWLHVSDLKGWGNEAAKEYAVNSIPANFLVDGEGVIVGANLREEDLMKKLDELLK